MKLTSFWEYRFHLELKFTLCKGLFGNVKVIKCDAIDNIFHPGPGQLATSQFPLRLKKILCLRRDQSCWMDDSGILLQ